MYFAVVELRLIGMWLRALRVCNRERGYSTTSTVQNDLVAAGS
jgi:hypothetical protein